jgi:hypothetical protein
VYEALHIDDEAAAETPTAASTVPHKKARGSSSKSSISSRAQRGCVGNAADKKQEFVLAHGNSVAGAEETNKQHQKSSGRASASRLRSSAHSCCSSRISSCISKAPTAVSSSTTVSYRH